jgi:hypothetical protein
MPRAKICHDKIAKNTAFIELVIQKEKRSLKKTWIKNGPWS